MTALAGPSEPAVGNETGTRGRLADPAGHEVGRGAEPLTQKLVFIALVPLMLTPQVNAVMALAIGIAWGIVVGDPWGTVIERMGQRLLKVCVVGLGFGLSLAAILSVGRVAIGVTAVGILLTLLIGIAAGRWLRVERCTSTLISGGTAICGGSAIAALAGSTGAASASVAVAMAIVFILNAVALFVFPAVAHLLSLTQEQFGYWSALAIHDTSAVVGAASAYGHEALELATVVKLTRALWILPITLAVSLYFRRVTPAGSGSFTIPWFIVLFIGASTLRMVAPGGEQVFDALSGAARQGLVLTLFLIGVGLTRARLQAAGFRPLVQGMVVWVFIAVSSLLGVLWLVPGVSG